MLMVYSNLSQYVSPPLGLLGRLDQRVHHAFKRVTGRAPKWVRREELSQLARVVWYHAQSRAASRRARVFVGSILIALASNSSILVICLDSSPIPLSTKS